MEGSGRGEPTGLRGETVRQAAGELDGRLLGPRRAAEIAAEVDRLNRLVLDAGERWLDLSADPAGFAVALDRLGDRFA